MAGRDPSKAGGFAVAYYGGIPQDVAVSAKRRLDPKLSDVIHRFRKRFDLASKNTTVFEAQ